MKNLDTDNLIALLCCFHFWNLKTTNSKGKTRYECTINHEKHYFTANRGAVNDAIRSAIEKANAGPMPRRRAGEKKPFMRMAGTE